MQGTQLQKDMRQDEPDRVACGCACLIRHHGYDSAMIQFTKSLASLMVERVDLFLLHYPACAPGLCSARELAGAQGTWRDSWRALESLVGKGLVRAIGARPLGCLPYFIVMEGG
jgi:aryl-alcohol dehydrogenase-like predicted oxidoreductase